MGQPVDKLAELGRQVAAAQDAQLEGVRLSTEERLLASPPARTKSRQRRTVVAALAAAALAAASMLLFWPRALTFEVGDGATAGHVEQWIAAPAHAELPLRFSDGTSLVLGAGSRARVTGTDRNGAKLAVERGRVEATVVSRPGSSWRLLFGPFEVQVTGTEFVADWSPASQRLTVELREGSVLVRGPALGDGHALTAGSTLDVSAVERRATIRPTDAEPEPEPPARSPVEEIEPEQDAGVAAADDAGAAEEPAATAAPAVRMPRWRRLYEAGKYRDALREAKAEGFESLCANSGAAELLMLAETARLGGDSASARRALTELRQRHAGSAQAAVAAFNLGTMAFDHRGAYGEAAQWFTVYLAEQPGGALAREAAGRLMEALERAGNRAAARKAAESYLAAYPRGPHAAGAKRLLDSSPPPAEPQ